MEKVKFAWSKNKTDEIWRGGPCNTIKECAEEALAEGYKEDDKIALGYVEPYEVNSVNSDQIIEYLQIDAYDSIGEVAEDWLNYITREQYEDLEDRVLKVVKEWLKDVNEEPTFYRIMPFDEVLIRDALGGESKDGNTKVCSRIDR